MEINNEKDLIKIIQKNKFDEIKEFFNKNKIESEKLNYFYETLYFLIKENYSLEIINFFIEQQNVFYKYQSIDNTGLLYYSIEINNFKVAKLLLKNGARIDNKDNNVIKYLLRKRKLDSEKLLFILNIVKNASLCTINIICEIVKNGTSNIFKEIMEYNYYDIDFIINIILLSKKNITFTNDELKNYFYNNNKSIIKINEKNDNEDYLSLVIITKDSINVVNNIKLLFEYANRNNIILDINNQCNKFYDYPLCAITRGNYIEVLELFIEYANRNNIILDINDKYSDEKFPLRSILYNNSIEMLKIFIKYAEEKNILINLNVIHYYRNNVIMTIANYSSMDIFYILIEYAKKHNIKIKLLKADIFIIELCEKKNKKNMINIIDNHKDVFEYVKKK